MKHSIKIFGAALAALVASQALAALTVTHIGVSNITATSAVFYAQLTGTNGSALGQTGALYYGASNGGTNPASWASSNHYGNIAALGQFSNTVITLSGASMYYYRFRVVEGTGVAWGAATTNMFTSSSLPTNTPVSTNCFLLVQTNGVLVAPTNFFGANTAAISAAETDPRWSAVSNAFIAATNGLNTRAGALETATNALNTRAGSLETATNALNTRADALEAATNSINERTSLLETSTNALNARVGPLETATNSLNGRTLALETSTNVLNDRTGLLETSTNALNTRAGTLETATNALNDRVGPLETATNALNIRAGSLETATNALDTRAGLVETATNTLNSRAIDLETATNALNARAGLVETATNALNTRAGALETSTNALNTRAGLLETATNALQEQISDIVIESLASWSTFPALSNVNMAWSNINQVQAIAVSNITSVTNITSPTGLLRISGGVSEGDSTATVVFAHAEGNITRATGTEGSHSEGWNTLASGNYGAHAEGETTIASGYHGSHAEGLRSAASSDAAHAEGIDSVASGSSSHSEGSMTLASEESSHAAGHRAKATNNISYVWSSSDLPDDIGNATMDYGSHTSGTYNVFALNGVHLESSNSVNLTPSTLATNADQGLVIYGVRRMEPVSRTIILPYDSTDEAIQAAVDALGKFIPYGVTITIQFSGGSTNSGGRVTKTLATPIYIQGFYGPGTLMVTTTNTVDTAVGYTNQAVGIVTPSASYGFYVQSCQLGVIGFEGLYFACNAPSGAYGFFADMAYMLRIRYCLFATKPGSGSSGIALRAQTLSKVHMVNCTVTGTNMNTLARAVDGGHVVCSGHATTAFIAGTAFRAGQGGLIQQHTPSTFNMTATNEYGAGGIVSGVAGLGAAN